MSPVPPPRRPLVLKADRDTLWLLAAASGMALALAYSVHGRPTTPAPLAAQQVAAEQWAGELAGPRTTGAVAPTEPLTSAALVVPKAAMALPAVTAVAANRRPCERAPCAAAKSVVAAPSPPRRVAAPVRPVREASLADALNPLNHIPEIVKRPFASAGDTIAGWVRRF